MPGYKAHISFGILWYSIALLIVYKIYMPSIILMGELAVCIALGSLFPDIDIKSKGQKYMYTIFFITAIPLLYMHYFFIVAVGGWLLCIPMMVKHRGIFHDPLIMHMLIIVLWFLWYIHFSSTAKQYILHVLCFTLGMYSHVMLDYGIAHFFKKLIKTRKRRIFRH
jgi:hypothetical protein